MASAPSERLIVDLNRELINGLGAFPRALSIDGEIDNSCAIYIVIDDPRSLLPGGQPRDLKLTFDLGDGDVLGRKVRDVDDDGIGRCSV